MSNLTLLLLTSAGFGGLFILSTISVAYVIVFATKVSQKTTETVFFSSMITAANLAVYVVFYFFAPHTESNLILIVGICFWAGVITGTLVGFYSIKHLTRYQKTIHGLNGSSLKVVHQTPGKYKLVFRLQTTKNTTLIREVIPVYPANFIEFMGGNINSLTIGNTTFNSFTLGPENLTFTIVKPGKQKLTMTFRMTQQDELQRVFHDLVPEK